MADSVAPTVRAVAEPPRTERAPGAGRSAAGRLLRSYGPAALLIAALIGVWELIARVGHVQDYILPAPDQIASTLYDDRTVLLSALSVTGREVAFGFLIALGVALAVAVTLHASGILRRTLYPLIVGSQTIPLVVVAPILAIIMGYNIGPKLVVIALICFFPIAVSTLDGLRSVDPELVRMMRTLYGTRWIIFRRVELPSALPSLFSGARIAGTYAAIGAVFGEWSGSTNGLGYVMIQAIPQLQTALVFAAIVILALISIALFGIVSLVERLTIPWAFEERKVT